MKTWIYFLLASTLLNAQTPDKIKKSEDDIRQDMLKISRQLGVTCTECHLNKNFKTDGKASFKVALVHMKMVDLLKQNGLSGKNGEPEASCYTCHHGLLKFQHKEKFDDHFRSEPLKKSGPLKEDIIDDKATDDKN